jgi:hypothetical protein
MNHYNVEQGAFYTQGGYILHRKPWEKVDTPEILIYADKIRKTL